MARLKADRAGFRGAAGAGGCRGYGIRISGAGQSIVGGQAGSVRGGWDACHLRA